RCGSRARRRGGTRGGVPAPGEHPCAESRSTATGDKAFMTQPAGVAVVGSTGSIGTQALDIVRAAPDRFRVVGLTAGGSNRELFDAQVAEVAAGLSGLGADASAEAASRPCDVVLNGITGAVGLGATLATLDAGN